MQRQQDLIDAGLKSQFDEPVLHITVSKKYVSSYLPELPKFDITVRNEIVYENQNQRHSWIWCRDEMVHVRPS